MQKGRNSLYFHNVSLCYLRKIILPAINIRIKPLRFFWGGEVN
jgi:hypothetical protein